MIVETRTRYERYIGEYVLHCHILEHEDQGMMQSVQVVLPRNTSGGGHAGHHH
ncbi:MAG TPA: multicopper oxidase domain-containing protein [Cellvibrio sp.]